jgi:hypothetical protein
MGFDHITICAWTPDTNLSTTLHWMCIRVMITSDKLTLVILFYWIHYFHFSTQYTEHIVQWNVCKLATWHSWLHFYRTGKIIVNKLATCLFCILSTYSWSTLLKLATCLFCMLSTFLLFMLWFCTYFNLSVLTTQKKWQIIYQFVQMKVFPSHLPAEHPFCSFFAIDRQWNFYSQGSLPFY